MTRHDENARDAPKAWVILHRHWGYRHSFDIRYSEFVMLAAKCTRSANSLLKKGSDPFFNRFDDRRVVHESWAVDDFRVRRRGDRGAGNLLHRLGSLSPRSPPRQPARRRRIPQAATRSRPEKYALQRPVGARRGSGRGGRQGQFVARTADDPHRASGSGIDAATLARLHGGFRF